MITFEDVQRLLPNITRHYVDLAAGRSIPGLYADTTVLARCLADGWRLSGKIPLSPAEVTAIADAITAAARTSGE